MRIADCGLSGFRRFGDEGRISCFAEAAEDGADWSWSDGTGRTELAGADMIVDWMEGMDVGDSAEKALTTF
jgi:hypothetical protein